MKSRNILHKTLMLLALLPLGACSSWLDEAPLVNQTEATFFNDAGNAITAVNACYDPLTWGQQGLTMPVSFSHAYEFMIGNTCTDDGAKGSTAGDLAEIQALREWRATADNQNLAGLWYNPFVGIYRCNLVLNNLPDGDVAEPLKSRLLGEAYFLRGYYHFQLVRMFGGVPLFTEPVDPAQITDGTFSRASIAEVYAQVNADFIAAAERLPTKGEYDAADMGRATAGAANAYLARAYMYQLGTDNGNGITWQQVYDAAAAVVASGQYALAPNYATLFEVASENGIESIFEIQALESGTEDSFLGAGTIETVFTNPFGTIGWGFNIPTTSLRDAFAADDPRLYSTIFQEGQAAHGIEIDVSSGDRSETGLLNRKKMLDPAHYPSNSKDSPQNIRKMRYADVLLMQAEAAYHVGNEGEARSLVNQVRARARTSTFPMGYNTTNPTGYDPTGFLDNVSPLLGNVSGNDLLQAIWLERRLEFGMESLRFWDLVRTGRYLATIEATLGAEVSTRTTARSVQGSENPIPLFPIPSVEVSAWGIAQNPGY